jgi:hypothetical protein
VFGCVERVFVGHPEGGVWAEPVEVGRGDALFAFEGVERSWLVTTFGVMRSTDGGATFAQAPGLDALGGAFAGGRLMLLLRDPAGATLVRSDDEGQRWDAQTRVLEAQPVDGPFVAADGDAVSVARATASELVLTTSFDAGERWSEPRRLPRGGVQKLLGLAQRDDATLWLTAGEDDALALCVLR